MQADRQAHVVRVGGSWHKLADDAQRPRAGHQRPYRVLGVRNATGDTTPDISLGVKMVAFQYARHGWALLEAEGTANLLRIATNVRYGQATPIRWRVQLTSLPPRLRTVQVEFDRVDSRLVGFTLVLAEHARRQPRFCPPSRGHRHPAR
jgi:hypothetical protein